VKTSTMEIWNCSNCEITFESGAASTKTTQIDDSENVTLFPLRDAIGLIYHGGRKRRINLPCKKY